MRLFSNLIFLLFLLLSFTAKSQSNSDTSLTFHDPKKATIMSALAPGLGQAYNKKYWKIPVIYAGFGVLGYFIKVNNDDYKIYKDAYKLRLDGDESTIDPYVGIYSDNDLTTLKNYYRRNRDLSIIGVGVLYLLNILDASVDAHLFNFNVSDDLSINVQPEFVPGPFAHTGLNLKLRF